MEKKLVNKFFILSIISLICVGAFNFVVDPFIYYRYPMVFNMNPLFDYGERYMNPGIARNTEYNSIIIGSSLSRNFKSSWFDDAYDIETVKLTYSGATSYHYELMLELVDTEEIEYVFANIDLSTFSQNINYTEIPYYLYDDNYLNDTKYLLDKYSLSRAILTVLKSIGNTETVSLDDAFNWSLTMDFKYGEEQVLSYLEGGLLERQINQGKAQIDTTIEENLSKFIDVINNNKHIQFEFFVSPQSLIYWIDRYQTGNLDSDFYNFDLIISSLLELDNVNIYFPGCNEIISNLDNYTDLVHYNEEVQYYVFEVMANKENQLTDENYKGYLDNLYSFIIDKAINGIN